MGRGICQPIRFLAIVRIQRQRVADEQKVYREVKDKPCARSDDRARADHAVRPGSALEAPVGKVIACSTDIVYLDPWLCLPATGNRQHLVQAYHRMEARSRTLCGRWARRRGRAVRCRRCGRCLGRSFSDGRRSRWSFSGGRRGRRRFSGGRRSRRGWAVGCSRGRRERGLPLADAIGHPPERGAAGGPNILEQIDLGSVWPDEPHHVRAEVVEHVGGCDREIGTRVERRTRRKRHG